MKKKDGLVPLRLALPTWVIAWLDEQATKQHKTIDEIANEIFMEMLQMKK